MPKNFIRDIISLIVYLHNSINEFVRSRKFQTINWCISFFVGYIFCLENKVCFVCLLHKFKYTAD